MKQLKNRKGVTLVELLVTFTLFAIFMVAAIGVITPSMQIFLKVKYMSYAQNVSTMVMSKIEDEIAMATGKVLVDTTGNKISLEDGYTSPLYIEVDTDKLMKIHYRALPDALGVYKDAVDWKYDNKAYQGFTITKLEFAPSSGNKGVKITLDLSNKARQISYSTTKVIECYNLAQEDTVTTGTVVMRDEDYTAP